MLPPPPAGRQPRLPSEVRGDCPFRAPGRPWRRRGKPPQAAVAGSRCAGGAAAGPVTSFPCI